MAFFNPARPSFLIDPYPALARLRAEEPVHWSPTLAAWVVTSYERCAEVLYDVRRFGSASPGAPAVAEARPLVATDPPDHDRLRHVIAAAMAPGAVEVATARIRSTLAPMIEALPVGDPFDLVAAYASVAPSAAVEAYAGVGGRVSIEEARHVTQPTPGAPGTAVAGARAALRTALDEADDPASLAGVIAAGLQDGALREAEAVHLLADALSAGADATAYAIANGVAALIDHAEAYAALGERYALGPAVEELLRYDSSTQAVARFAWGATSLGRARIGEGDRVLVLVGAANRDPAAFEEPDRLLLDRTPNRHLSFALGPHYCLGAPLARLILGETLAGLRMRFDTLALGPGGGERRGNYALRGFSRLEVVGG